MPILPCQTREFAPEFGVRVDCLNYLTVTWMEVIHAAITVGRRGWYDVWQHGSYSVFEMLYRASMIFANLGESPAGCIRKTVANEWLDPSEKSAISYFMGLTFAKLMATRLLDVHWVMHLDVYAQHLQPTLTPAGRRRRPDLVGLDTSGRWCVLEAKGRADRVTDRMIENAKAQTRALRTIRGVDPHLRVASISHFVNKALCVHFEDPKDVDEDAFDLDISETQFTRDYYRPFIHLMDQTRTEAITLQGHKIRVVGLPGADLRIGLNEEIREHMLADKKERHLLHRETANWLDESRGILLGGDGILVELGKTWSSEMMSLEPWDRLG